MQLEEGLAEGKGTNIHRSPSSGCRDEVPRTICMRFLSEIFHRKRIVLFFPWSFLAA